MEQTPIELARQRYGRDFGSQPYQSGPTFYTQERVAEMARENEELRRQRAARETK